MQAAVGPAASIEAQEWHAASEDLHGIMRAPWSGLADVGVARLLAAEVALGVGMRANWQVET